MINFSKKRKVASGSEDSDDRSKSSG
jgi:hypothetical protein